MALLLIQKHYVSRRDLKFSIQFSIVVIKKVQWPSREWKDSCNT